MPVIPQFIRDFVRRPDLTLGAVQRLRLEQYLTALLVCGSSAMEFLNRKTGGREEGPGIRGGRPWDDLQIEEVRNRLLQETLRLQECPSGVLVLESPWEGPAPDGRGGEAQGGWATSYFVCGPFQVPLDFTVCRTPGTAPREGARESLSALKDLFGKAMKRDLPLGLVRMDAWFLCREAVDFLEARQHFPYLSPVGGDSRVMVRNNSRTLRSFVHSLPEGEFRTSEGASDRPFRYVSKRVRLADLGEVRLVAAYDRDPKAGEPRFQVTNQMAWDAEGLLRDYGPKRFLGRYSQGLPNPWGERTGGSGPLPGLEWRLRMVFLAETLFQLNALAGQGEARELEPGGAVRAL